MSPKLKYLSGNEVISIFNSFSFIIHSQKGSHVKLRRVIKNRKQTLTIPLHDEIDSGTLRAIVRQASHYIPENELHSHFYCDYDDSSKNVIEEPAGDEAISRHCGTYGQIAMPFGLTMTRLDVGAGF